ncbi:DUF2141 domain-containing protein [Sphingomonas sp.]|uniref:DUF2141 domain-containing protein n=1 Tax=Sphingomonas sp. TaxID=28214 RepID=UPI002B7D69E7|nr:DUF2141 domain-containing protein [Sphingomonas sp.]HTG38605.1 DUF2141 domain-containing protein [Sphingomonas sp.]
MALIGASPVTTLTVDLDALRNARGMVRLCLTAAADNFPTCVDDDRAVARSVPATQSSLSYDGLPPGGYALAVIHDENGNGKLDTFMGIPREGFGFSRNPRIAFGPPSFKSARFTLSDLGDEQRIRMRYMF